MSNNDQCKLTKGFTIREKLWAQLSFFGMGIPGTIAIIEYNWLWVFPYVFVFWYGIPGIIMRHINCPRCPHFHEYGDCLQAPVFITRWTLKNIERKYKPYSLKEKILFYTIFLTIPVYPIYFLIPNKILLIVFLASVAIWYGGQVFYFCKTCRVKDCPFNRVKVFRK